MTTPTLRRGVAALFPFSLLMGAAFAGCTSDSDNPGAADAGVNDGAVRDTLISDTPVGDTALPDTSVADTAVSDSAAPDTSVPDTSVPDTSVPDTSSDASMVDSAIADTSTADTSDTSLPDSASPDTSPSTDAAFATTANLLLNGDAEAAAGSSSAQVVPVPDWTSAGEATVVTYDAPGGYPLATDPGPADRGLNFFCGGASDAVSTFTQHVDLTTYIPAIALGNVTYTLAGYLGGFSSQSDNATLSITFFDATTANVGTGTIGPVTPADRADATGLLFRTGDGAVPETAVSADVVLTLTRTEGSANDGYADDLSLTLTGH